MPESRPVALVTGASSGIGRASAKRLLAAGYRVFGTSRRPEAPTLDGFEMLPLEVASDESVAECVRTVAEKTGGRIDLLLSNVGTGILGAAEESSAEQVKRLFDINYLGGVRITNAVLPMMRARGSGKILFMSSSGGVASLPFAAYYCATKHALEAYAEALRGELTALNIAVSLIAPGPVSTPAGDTAMKPDRPQEVYAADRERLSQKFVEAIRKGMDPDKVARVVVKAARARWPKARYRVGFSSKMTSLMRALMPETWFLAATRRAVGR